MGKLDQSIRDVAKGASVVSAGLFLELVIAFLAQVLAARYLSVSGFGGLTTGTAVLNIGAILGGLGLASGLTRYFRKVPEGMKQSLAGVTVGLTLVTSIALGVVTFLQAEFISTVLLGDASVTTSVRVFGAAIPFAALLNVAIGGIRGQKNSRYRVYVMNVLHPVSRFGLVVVAVVYGLGELGIASAYALPYVVSAGFATYLLHRILPAAEASIDRSRMMEVARYSVPFTLSGIASFVYRSIDIFLILRYLGSFAVGAYGVAYAAVSFVGMLSTAFNYLGSPIASELEDDGDPEAILEVFNSIARWLVIGSICVFVPVGLFSTEFIGIIYGSGYASGGAALTVLAVGFAVKNVLSIHGPILQGLGRSKELSINSTVAAVANFLLNVVLIPEFGIVGAAVATSLSFLLRDVMAVIQVRWYLGSSPLALNTLVPVAIAVPLLTPLALYHHLLPATLLWLLATTVAFSVVYVLAVLALGGLSASEVMLLRSIEEKYDLEHPVFDVFIGRFS